MATNTRILIIDDDPLMSLLVAKTIESLGMTATTVTSGEAGINLYKEQGADAILLDVVMPNGMNGFETCRALRELPESRCLPIMMMTVKDDMESLRNSYTAGATDFIAKPLNFPLLGYRLQYMLRSSDTTKQLFESERRLHRIAYFDNLTGLPNRQFFREHLQMTIALAERLNLKLGLMYLDMDGLKRINDSLGHHVGDQFLKEIGDRLRHSLRITDAIAWSGKTDGGSAIARLGGDEFTILLSPITRNEDAALVAERIRQILSKPYIFDNHEVYASVSIGISTYPDDSTTAEGLLQNADLAMYHTKRTGGDGFRYFSKTMTEIANRRLTMETYLRKALEREEMELHYQPQFAVRSGDCIGVEALLRWHSQELGQMPPSEFITLAEKSGLILSIGEWVLKTAAKQAKTWLDKGLPVARISVNVSTLQFIKKDFPAIVQAILHEVGLPPERLDLELTESALEADEVDILDMLVSLKQMGVSLSIDDFGTGYSSLSRLKKFPISTLKIDKNFIQDIETDSANAAIVAAVIAMGKGLDMKTIAEGVETVRQLNFLKTLGCDQVQGFLLAKPMTSDQVEKFFSTSVRLNFNSQ
ncbi:MAG: EAL domain-containing protein [Methylococcaceae bacterium]|nr:EAL domain-containing protein [Methylococcaceae bacterium]